jgi:hypothetical protein
MDRRAELLGWIEQTRKLQRKFAIVFPVLVAMCSFWVTASHNAAHRQKLDELARVERNQGKPLTTAHRRWHH